MKDTMKQIILCMYAGASLLIGDVTPIGIVMLLPIYIISYISFFVIDWDYEVPVYIVSKGKVSDSFVAELSREIHERTSRKVHIIEVVDED